MPDAGFAAQHDRVRLFEYRVGHICDLGPCRNPIRDHRFKQMGGDHDRFAQPNTTFDDSSLNDRQFFHRHFDAKIAAGDHDKVRDLNNVIDRLDRGLILYLGQHLGFAFFAGKQIAKLGEIAGFSNKAERNEVDAELRSECNVSNVLFCKRWKADVDAR